MRKRLFLFIMVLILMFAMTGCADADKNKGQNEGQIDSEQLAAYLAEHITFQDMMDRLDDLPVAELYDLDADEFETMTVYASTGATAEEIAVFSVKTEEQIEEITEAIHERIEDQQDGFRNYVPSELTKLANPLVTQVENCIVFVVCDDKAQAESVLRDYIAEE